MSLTASDAEAPPFREQRTNRAIRQAAGQNFFFRRAPFAFEITAGELTRGGRFLAVIHGQGEEFLAGFGLAGGDSRHHDDGFAELDGDRSIGLFGEFAGFDDDLR
jgi:hypothetical protein